MNFALRLITLTRSLTLALLMSNAAGSQKAALVETSISLLETWSQNQHLYVRGDIDSAARKAMQNGGRLIDAVKNTVTLIDQRVATTIQSRESKRTAQLARTKAEISNLESHLSIVSEKKAAIISELDGDVGDNAKIPVNEMKDKIKTAGITGCGILGVIAYVGNRRRRKTKTQAEELLTTRKIEMKETGELLFELMDRASVIVGPINELGDRGYTGDTLKLSREALKQIDEAFVLSSHVQKIIEQAEDLIAPGNPLARSRNLVSRGRYERAVDLLDAELSVGLKNVPSLEERTRPGEEVDESFSLPIEAWQQRTAKALKTADHCLDTVENAWSTIVSRSEALTKNITALEARQGDIQRDEWLRCEATFEEWIPAMFKIHQRAVTTGKSDPVRGLEEDMKLGDRMASEAKDLLEHLTAFRANDWEDLQKNEAILDQHQRATLWVDDALLALNKLCDKLPMESQEKECSSQIEVIAKELTELPVRVASGANLIKRATDDTFPAIKKTEDFVTKTKREIGTSLSLSPEEVLIEEGHCPGTFLKKARHYHEAALAALDLGEVRSTQDFLDEVDALTQHARDLAKQSREILDHYAASSEALWQRRGALVRQAEKMNQKVEALRLRYAPRALLLDPEAPGGGSHADTPAQVSALLKNIVQRLERAKNRFHDGGLLEARDLIADGVHLASEGEAQCGEVSQRLQRLQQLEETNAEHFASQRRTRTDLHRQMQDRRVTRETLTRFEKIGTNLDQIEKEIAAGDGRRDPYLVENILEDLKNRLPNLRQDLAGDFEEHVSALELFETVKRNQHEAAHLWKTAETDQIANSPATNAAMSSIENCQGQLDDQHRSLQIDHADWREIQRTLRTIHLTLSEAVLSLKHELTLAREAVRALDAATREVHKAARWSGSHGIRISGNYGSRSLAAAHDVMQHGSYQEALQMAGQARASARQAIAQAEAREAAKRRAEAAARRSRQAASRPSSFTSSTRRSGSRMGSGGGSRSSSSGSGMGRSSFGSGSGMGRSGW